MLVAVTLLIFAGIFLQLLRICWGCSGAMGGTWAKCRFFFVFMVLIQFSCAVGQQAQPRFGHCAILDIWLARDSMQTAPFWRSFVFMVAG